MAYPTSRRFFKRQTFPKYMKRFSRKYKFGKKKSYRRRSYGRRTYRPRFTGRKGKLHVVRLNPTGELSEAQTKKIPKAVTDYLNVVERAAKYAADEVVKDNVPANPVHIVKKFAIDTTE